MPGAEGLYFLACQHFHGFGFFKQVKEGENGMKLAIYFFKTLFPFFGDLSQGFARLEQVCSPAFLHPCGEYPRWKKNKDFRDRPLPNP